MTFSAIKRTVRAWLVEFVSDDDQEMRWILEPAAHPDYTLLSPAARHVSGLLAQRVLLTALSLAAPLLAMFALTLTTVVSVVLVSLGVPSPGSWITELTQHVARLDIPWQAVLALVAATAWWFRLVRRLRKLCRAQEALLERRVEPQLIAVWECRGQR
jgi:hypothetical protein